MKTIQQRVLITGLVQGVGFRASTAQAARSFPTLKGFVRNLPDGRVEAVFAGPEDDVKQMVQWCHKGPPSSKVLKVEMSEEPVSNNLYTFRIA